MQINCIVIDDEPLAVAKLEDFIARIPRLRLSKTFDSAVDAAAWLKENKTDLIFLDIRMEQLTGIEFLEATGPKAAIIITSAYDQYALKGYELNVSDYLLKPYSFGRFLKAVNKIPDSQPVNHGNTDERSDEDYLFIKTEYRFERVSVDDILYIEGMKDYLRIVCHDRKVMTLQSFSKLMENLPAKKFCRVHKSFVVALNKIRSIERGVVVIADQRIPLSNNYKDNFLNMIRLS